MDAQKQPYFMRRLSGRLRQGLLVAAAYAILLIICLLAISPEQYDISVGDVAPQTITASRDIEDEVTTNRRRQQAADAVSPVYYKDDSISETVLADMENAFTELRAVRELGSQIKAGWAEDDAAQFSEEDYAQASGLLGDLTLSNYQLRTLMNTDETDFENLYQSLRSATRTALVSTITEGQINDAINNIQQIVAYNTRTDLWYNVAIPTLRAILQPNMLIDQEATEENRQRAYDAVEPTVYKQDQNIVVKGDRVSAEQIAVLDALGLLRGNSFDASLYAEAAVVVALILAAAILYASLFAPSILAASTDALVSLLACVLTLLLSLIIGQYAGTNAMPVTLAAMLVVSLCGARVAYVANLVTSLLITFLTVKSTGLMTSQMLGVLLMSSVGGMTAIFMLKRNAARVYVLVTGLVVAAVECVVLLCTGGLASGAANPFAYASQAAIGSLTAAILCVGLQPMLESSLNLVTPAKLIELSSPNQPLLRRLMIETPGTYHHSMVVANLAEAAAEEIGANALLARVGAYYHDIGKLVRPMYFKENQLGENPHDNTDPRVSTAILTAHTRDGADLAQRHHLPEPIVDMICQHHGDTPVMYFYAKAVKQHGEENVDIADFRYDGPKPRSAEAAILMLADTVEAAVRSIQQPNQAKISEMIRKLVRGKMEDGQLDECTLTFRDIGHICSAFETVLQGVFHQRIEYPNVDLKRAKRHSQQKSERAKKAQEEDNPSGAKGEEAEKGK